MKGKKPNKPSKTFPLSAANNGQWCKKIRGRIHYFGVWANASAALERYKREREDLEAGRVPRASSVDNEGAVDIRYLTNKFLESRTAKQETGELSERTFAEYLSICQRIRDELGASRLLSDIRIEDFDAMRAKLAIGVTGKKISPVRLGNLIRRVRTVFKFANEIDLIERPIKFGPGFVGPSKKALREARGKRGKRLITADELRAALDGAKPIMRAMLLLGINCGFGNTDIANLRKSHVSICPTHGNWVEFPRPKTGIERRSPLWPETAEALTMAIAKRPKPKLPEHEDLVFVTKYGSQFVRTGSTGQAIDSVYAEFAKLLKRLKLDRDNLAWYAIRHTFATVGGAALDPQALESLMGHVPHSSDMSAPYNEGIGDDRLMRVSNYVRTWLFPDANDPKIVNRKA